MLKDYTSVSIPMQQTRESKVGSSNLDLHGCHITICWDEMTYLVNDDHRNDIYLMPMTAISCCFQSLHFGLVEQFFFFYWPS